MSAIASLCALKWVRFLCLCSCALFACSADRSTTHEQQCMTTYSASLSSVRRGLGEEVYGLWQKISPTHISYKPVLINLGFGHSGTRSFNQVVSRLGLSNQHWGSCEDRRGYRCPSDADNINYLAYLISLFETWVVGRRPRGSFFRHEVGAALLRHWSASRTGFSDSDRIALCHDRLANLSVEYPVVVDSLSDQPIGHLFWHLYLTHPNARFMLTQRPALSWAVSRRKNAKNCAKDEFCDLAPMLFPCGRTLADFTLKELSTMYHAYVTLVKCLIPNILVVDVFSRPNHSRLVNQLMKR